jgi:hypothetical protein
MEIINTEAHTGSVQAVNLDTVVHVTDRRTFQLSPDGIERTRFIMPDAIEAMADAIESYFSVSYLEGK